MSAFEKIKMLLEERISEAIGWNQHKVNALRGAIEIVNQVAEEYKNGHYGCNMNGQHERCVDCGLRGECSHYNTEWFAKYSNSEIPNKYVSIGVYKQVAWERDIAIEQLHELGYEFGQKIEYSNSEIPNMSENLTSSNDGWIPVSSGNMPETEEECWITYEDYYGNLHVGQDIYCDYGGWDETQDTAVKAWMYVNAPAPYQPKGEK